MARELLVIGRTVRNPWMSFMKTLRRPLSVLALGLSLSGCIAFETPANQYDLGSANGYMAQRGAIPADTSGNQASVEAANQARCDLPAPPPPSDATVIEQEPLSPGDLVRVTVDGDAPPTGNYKIDSRSVISLVGVGDLVVAGLTATQAESDLDKLLVQKQFFQPGFAHASLRILQRGPARIIVTGAVFQSGQVTINEPSPTGVDTVQETAVGDYAIGRTLSIAISHAGGVRPDADLSRITITHDGKVQAINLTGVLTGVPFVDPVLAEGDVVAVPSRHCFQIALARPTPITPPGVKIFISNLTTPAASNASSSIGSETTSFAYGTRLLQVLVAGNCVGGTQITNADRFAVLITTNPETGDTEVLQRRIEALVRRADRDAYNPVIMPGDAVACYDSDVQNIRDVLKSLGDVGVSVAAASVLKGL